MRTWAKLRFSLMIYAMPSLLGRCFVAAGALLLMPCAAIGIDVSSTVADRDVHVERANGGFTVDLLMHAPVSPTQAWNVLTDFDHMADFVPNLKTSQVVERSEALLRVSQTGTARYGVFWTDFESLREIRLMPPSVTAWLAGSTCKAPSVITGRAWPR